MADADATRDLIIRSLFSKRASDGSYEETYISHLLIHEDAASEGQPGDVKERYLLLTVDRSGRGFVYKSKKNSNGTFSIGKTWKLEELRGVEALATTSFSLTFARRYRWDSLNQRDQVEFLSALPETFQRVTGGRPLTVKGLNGPQRAPANVRISLEDSRPARAATPPAPANLAPARPRPPIMPDRNVSSSSYGSYMNTVPNGASPASRQQPRPPQTTQPPQPSSLRSQSPSPAPPPRPLPPAISIPVASSSQPVLSTSIPRSASNTSLPPRTAPSPAPRTSSRLSESSRPSFENTKPAPSNLSKHPSRPSFDDTSSSRSPSRPPRPPSSNEPQTARPTLARVGSRPSFDSARAPTPADESRIPVPQPAVPPRMPTPPKPARPVVTPVRRQTSVSRISVFDPANQPNLERLLSADLSSAGGLLADEETAEVIIANVEEMLDGYEWNMPSGASNRRKGAADQMEARLMDELLALEKANVHSFVESDDRIGLVMQFIDDAIKELDDMDMMVQSYKIQLNAVGDDISYIQSQNRGLQVQTQNQKLLLDELDTLLQTVDVDREALLTLTQASLEQAKGIPQLEDAAAQLYKALLAGRENEMAATMERLEEYRTHNSQFCKRVQDFLSIMFQFQCDRLLNDKERAINKAQPQLLSHEPMEEYLGRYCGLMLYLKEMDEDRYAQVCATYFSAASGLHSKEMKTFLPALVALIRKGADDENEADFSSGTPNAIASGGIRRAATLGRSPLDRKKEKFGDGELRCSEAFTKALQSISQQITREEEFIADFIQVNDVALTFADYMKLENYYRRQAARYAGLTPATLKLVREAMDLIFGFLPGELKLWVEAAMRRDHLQIVGMLLVVERMMQEVEDSGKMFFHRLLEKQLRRMYQIFDRLMDEQVKAIEQTKLTTKKRKGVAHFIKYFPVFVSRVENQLIGADGFEIRNKIDSAYEKVVQAMFDCLQQMAKLDGGDSQASEDKGQLNYHVIMIENMHSFVADMSQLEIAATRNFVRRAESIYDDNLSAYLKLVLRRAFNKILLFFDGVEKILQSSPAADVPSNSAYNKSALKRVVKDYNAKDIRKIVDALFKRVEKHFVAASEGAGTTGGEDSIAAGPVLTGVWKACEEEVVHQTERFNQLISQCYGDTGITLDYTINDVQSSFKRNRA